MTRHPSRAVLVLTLPITLETDFVTFADIYDNTITDCGEVPNIFRSAQVD